MWTWFYQLSTPKIFYQRSQQWVRSMAWLGYLLLGLGLVWGLFLAPPDYQQGDAVRIMYIHVPCAFSSLAIYSFMAANAAMVLIWRIKLSDILLQVAAPIGASVTFLALVTGSLWGIPTWGTWWIWDARLTSELILLFLYLGNIGLRNALPPRNAPVAVAIFTLLGFVDIPLVHYSVNWWQTLHQGSSLSVFAKPHIANTLLFPLLTCLVGLNCLVTAEILARARSALLYRESDRQWVQRLRGAME